MANNRHFTILLSWFITGSPEAGLKIGMFEVITKMMLYYFHERAWYRINYGLDNIIRKWKKI